MQKKISMIIEGLSHKSDNSINEGVMVTDIKKYGPITIRRYEGKVQQKKRDIYGRTQKGFGEWVDKNYVEGEVEGLPVILKRVTYQGQAYVRATITSKKEYYTDAECKILGIDPDGEENYIDSNDVYPESLMFKVLDKKFGKDIKRAFSDYYGEKLELDF